MFATVSSSLTWGFSRIRELYPPNSLSRSHPPIHAHGSAVTINANGYQCGPNSAPRFHVAAAPTKLTTKPRIPGIIACHIGRFGASRADT